MKTMTATIAYPQCGLKRIATFQADTKQVSDTTIIALHGRRNQNCKADAYWQFDLSNVTVLQGKEYRALSCDGYIFLADKFNRFVVD